MARRAPIDGLVPTWPVAASSTVSLVEVSPIDRDAVERLVRRRLDQRLQHRRRDLRIGEDEDKHGAHIGRDHAGALGDADDVHRRARRSAPALAEPFGKVSVVMMARAASSQVAVMPWVISAGKAAVIR